MSNCIEFTACFHLIDVKLAASHGLKLIGIIIAKNNVENFIIKFLLDFVTFKKFLQETKIQIQNQNEFVLQMNLLNQIDEKYDSLIYSISESYLLAV